MITFGKINRGILTISEIKKLDFIKIDKDQITNEKCYSNASYDFRLGDEYYPPNDKNKSIKNVSLRADTSFTGY